MCHFSLLFTFFSVIGPASALAIARFIPLPQADVRAEDIADPMRMWLAVHGYTLVQVASSVGIVLSFGYADIDPPQANGAAHDPRAAIHFLILCMGFYVHGFFIQRWGKGANRVEEGQSSPWWIHHSKLLCHFLLLLVLIVSSPP